MDGADTAGVVRSLVEAVVRADYEAAAALCAPELHISVQGFDEIDGHDGLRGLMEFQREILRDASVEIHHVLTAGDTAAVERTEHFTIGDERVSLDVGAFFSLRDGLVTEWLDYQDLRDVIRALGH